MLLPLLELASNTALEHDPATRERLSKLSDKSMTLTIKNLQQSITFVPRQEGVELSAGVADDADVTLGATLSALVKIGRDGLDNAELEPGELEIQGDPIIGQRFAQLIAQLDIDWQSLLAERLGPAPASVITSAFGQARVVAKEGQTHFKRFLKDTLVNDLSVVAEASQVEPFLDDVDELRAQVDKLEARLAQLSRKTS